MTQPSARSDGPVPAVQSVLVVDDEEDQRTLLATLLHRAGYRVVPAATAEEALRLLESMEPGLALIDLLLPGMDGAELSRQIRHRYPGCPIVVMSVLDVDSYPRADAVLPKPFSRSQLTDVLTRLLPR